MQVDIQARDFTLTEALRTYIDRRIEFALSNRNNIIHQVKIMLSDINGPRGGSDKRCHIQLVLPKLSNVVIEDTESDLYIAIDRAGRTVARRLARKRTINRSSSKTRYGNDNEYISGYGY